MTAYRSGMKKRTRSRSRQSEQPQRIEPGTITSIEPQQHSTGRYSIFLDGEFAFGIGRDLLLESGIGKGDHLDQHRIDSILARDAIDRAVAAAMRALDQRIRSRRELYTRLQQKGFEPDAIDAALDRLRDYGYLDDERFAEQWIENRLAHRPRGKRMLEHELRQKGVDRQIIAETIDTLEVDDRAAAMHLGQKQLGRISALPVAEQKKKLGGMLARRGFDYEVIRSTLETLLGESDDDTGMGDQDRGMV